MKDTNTKVDPLVAAAMAAGLRALADDVRAGTLDPRSLLGRPLVPMAGLRVVNTTPRRKGRKR